MDIFYSVVKFFSQGGVFMYPILFVAGAAATGLTSVSTDTGVPVAFGVLTTDTMEQALARAGGKAGNKGWESALAVLEMLDLFHGLDGADDARDS